MATEKMITLAGKTKMDKLNIRNEMSALDHKQRDYYDSMTDDEKKKFAAFLMIRWGSAVTGDTILQQYYLASCNQRLNKNFFDISASKHKKFLWLLATTISPGMGNHYHKWISPKKKTNNNKAVKFLKQMFPNLDETDIEILAKINDKRDLKDLARRHGWDDKRIKAEL
jgi:hypothetical protein